MLPCDDSIQKYRIVTRILKLMHGFFVWIQGLCNKRHPRFSPYLVSLKFIGHFARTFILAIVPMSVPSFRPHLRFLLSIVSLNLTRSIAYRWKLSVFHEISIHRSSIAMVQYNVQTRSMCLPRVCPLLVTAPFLWLQHVCGTVCRPLSHRRHRCW